MLVVGELDGKVELFDACGGGGGGGKTRREGEGEEGARSTASSSVVCGCLQTFSDHKGAVTHMYVVRADTGVGWVHRPYTVNSL